MRPARLMIVRLLWRKVSFAGLRTHGAGHQAKFESGQTGHSRTACLVPPAHRATGTRHINPQPLSPCWATNVTARPAATSPATRRSSYVSKKPPHSPAPGRLHPAQAAMPRGVRCRVRFRYPPLRPLQLLDEGAHLHQHHVAGKLSLD